MGAGLTERHILFMHANQDFCPLIRGHERLSENRNTSLSSNRLRDTLHCSVP